MTLCENHELTPENLVSLNSIETFSNMYLASLDQNDL